MFQTYDGMIIGEHSRESDLDVNLVRTKENLPISVLLAKMKTEAISTSTYEYMKCEVIECCESLKNVLNVLAVGENEKSSKKVLNNLLKITLLPMPQKLINPTLFQMMLTYGSSFGTSISMELEHQFQYCRPSGCYGDAVIIHLCSAM
ncbi:uncharacterized protein LOC116404763 isoform X4 [Cucumis sativus]|uniref:uncharacterized protein LOC116404763 isoform X4 n=1 Tax=Cucumis sativus TaxID=3659 RepID=UPI0012F4DB57|nr:uncharacterized protein LOC116404763 isoform X4 [Cucumis sativus]